MKRDIIVDRDTYQRLDPAGATQLHEVAYAEVRAWAEIWNGNWAAALDEVRHGIDRLSGGRPAGRHAALWNYLAISIVIRLHHSTGDRVMRPPPPATSARPGSAAHGTTRPTISQPMLMPSTIVSRTRISMPSTRWRSKTLDPSADLGPAVFDAAVARMRTAVSSAAHAPYEQAFVELGNYAGASESLPGSKAAAAPDAAWLFGELT